VALTFPTYYTYERFVAAMDSFGQEKQHGESQPGKYTPAATMTRPPQHWYSRRRQPGGFWVTPQSGANPYDPSNQE